MRKEDLKDWTRDRLKDEVVNLSEKNFHLEWRIKQFEESEGRWKCEIESFRTENNELRKRIEKLESDICGSSPCIVSEFHSFEGKSWIRAEQYDEVLLRLQKANERTNKLEAENKALKQQIQYMKNILEAAYKPEGVENAMRKTGLFSEEKISGIMREAEKRLKEVCNYEPQLAPDDDISAFNYECMKQWVEELNYKKKNAKLQDQHQQDCIRINDLRTAYLITVDELAKLREQFGIGR